MEDAKHVDVCLRGLFYLTGVSNSQVHHNVQCLLFFSSWNTSYDNNAFTTIYTTFCKCFKMRGMIGIKIWNNLPVLCGLDGLKLYLWELALGTPLKFFSIFWFCFILSLTVISFLTECFTSYARKQSKKVTQWIDLTVNRVYLECFIEYGSPDLTGYVRFMWEADSETRRGE